MSATPLHALFALVLSLACTLAISTADAQTSHRVARGETLSSIASRYNVTIENLAAANRLSRSSTLRVGKRLKVPRKGIVYVQSGQTLSGIAKANGVSRAALAKRNGLGANATLRVGKKLVLPGYKVKARNTSKKSAPSSKSKRARSKDKGIVSLYRPALSRSVKIRLLDAQGRLRPTAARTLASLFADRRTKRSRRPNLRLIRLLARVSSHFGGKRMVIISGYRAPSKLTRRTSKHTMGDAVDIRIDGVTNEELRDYCNRFERVGVGYYPRSTFVHFDVRSSRASWVDWSRPGEAPHYLKPGEMPEEDEIDVVLDRGEEDVPTSVSSLIGR